MSSESAESLSSSSFLDPVAEIPQRVACSRNCFTLISWNSSLALIFLDPVDSPSSFDCLLLFLLTFEAETSLASVGCLFSSRRAASSLRTCRNSESIVGQSVFYLEKREREGGVVVGLTRVGLFPVVVRPRWANWFRSSSTLSLLAIVIWRNAFETVKRRGRKGGFCSRSLESVDCGGRSGLASLSLAFAASFFGGLFSQSLMGWGFSGNGRGCCAFFVFV